MRSVLLVALSASIACADSDRRFAGDASADSASPVDASFQFGDALVGDGGCVGLECQQTCATTTISGKVYDPAGRNGLYDVFVYVPNAPLAPLADGPTCTQCQAPATGNPVVSATTDADGNFTLTNAPDGDDIPIVLQLGKWRRHLTIPKVTRCVDNPQPDTSLRLPRKQHETSPDDNIPLIALTTGCDGAECFFAYRIGIDVSEFTGSNGSGRVRVYKSSNDQGQKFAGIQSGALGAEQLWNDLGEMMKYDIIFNACECEAFTRGPNGYENYVKYLDAGGRLFATHFFYNAFATPAQCGPDDWTCGGQPPMPSVGAWRANQNLPLADWSHCNGVPACLSINTTVPKGNSFADWYQANNVKLSTPWGHEDYGYCGLTDYRTDMGQLDPSLVAAGTATPWLYGGAPTDFPANYDAYYFSFNTPLGTDPKTQCGRATFSDVHLAEEPSGTFPAYCAQDPNASNHAPNQLALEFLFFDLSSCVQDDKQPPIQPN